MSGTFPHLVIDDFLPADLHAGLLGHALDMEDAFLPSAIFTDDGHGSENSRIRQSWFCKEGLGPWKKPFKQAVRERLHDFLQHLRIKPFEVAGTELQLVAHRDGSFFSPHIDTYTQGIREGRKTNRVLTLVYYLHGQPKGFSGGEIVLLPLSKGDGVSIDPLDNRLLAFPAIAPHEVRPVHCAIDDFANARFAVNCWLHTDSESK